jgi:hypothetical protein
MKRRCVMKAGAGSARASLTMRPAPPLGGQVKHATVRKFKIFIPNGSWVAAAGRFPPSRPATHRGAAKRPGAADGNCRSERPQRETARLPLLGIAAAGPFSRLGTGAYWTRPVATSGCPRHP